MVYGRDNRKCANFVKVSFCGMQNMTAVRKYDFVFSLTAVTNEPLKLYLWPVSRSGLRSKICKMDSDAKWADT
jgi:hypothetical protein